MSGAELRGRSASGHHGGEEGPDWWALAVRRCGRSARWLSGEVAPTSGAGLSVTGGRATQAWASWAVRWEAGARGEGCGPQGREGEWLGPRGLGWEKGKWAMGRFRLGWAAGLV